MGVIDTLSAGFGVINRRLWLILLPILLDLFLWYGPRLSVVPVALNTQRQLTDLIAHPPPELVAAPPSEAEIQQGTASVKQVFDFLSPYVNANFFTFVSWVAASQIATLSANVELNAPEEGLTGTVRGPLERDAAFQITSWPALIGLTLVLVAVSFLLVSVYFQTLAQRVQAVDPSSRRSLSWLVGRLLLNWLRLALFWLILGLFGFVIAAPTFVLAMVLSLVSPGLGSAVLISVMMVAVIWTVIFFYFAVQAIFINDVDPLRAIWYSVNVVQRNFWPALRLIAVIFLLSQGLPLALRLLAQHPAGAVVGIVGNAYVATALAAGSMIFYRERFQLWQASAVRRPQVIHQ